MKKILQKTILISIPMMSLGIIFMFVNFYYGKILFNISLSVLIIATLVYLIVNSKKINRSNKLKIKNLDIEQEVENLYDKLYNENIHSFEKSRIKIILKTLLAIIEVPLFFILVFKMYELQIDESLIYITSSIYFIGWICFVVCIGVAKDNYKNTYKNNIISEFIKLYNSNFKYFPTESYGISSLYKESNMDKGLYNTIDESDYIEGIIGSNIKIKMSELHVKNVTEIGNKFSHTQEIFWGLFAVVSTQNVIPKEIKINNKLLKENNNVVKIDNELFEKYFDVYCEDKILAMRVLTSEIIVQMIDFYENIENKFEIVMKDNNIYFKFNTGDLFEPKILSKSIKRREIYKYYYTLKFIVEIIENISKIFSSIDV